MPRFVVLNSKRTNRNVTYLKDGGILHQHLQCFGEDVGSPYSKFEFEPAKSTGNGGMVNIRCCYNNKYWVQRGELHNSVIASADEPDEDITKGSCTLFELVYVDVAKTTVKFLQAHQFLHAQNRRFVHQLAESTSMRSGCLSIPAGAYTGAGNAYEFEATACPPFAFALVCTINSSNAILTIK